MSDTFLFVVICVIFLLLGSIATLAFAAYIDAQVALERTQPEKKPTTSTFPDGPPFLD